MRNLILIPLIAFIFSGCNYATKQMVEQSNQEKVKLKKAIVKLIQKNNEVKQIIKEQEYQIEKLNSQITLLENDIQNNYENIEEIKKENKKKTIIISKDKKINYVKPVVELKQSNITDSFEVIVVNHMANIRENPDADSTIVGIGRKGDVYTVVDKSQGENFWYKIIYKARTLWIYNETVQKVGI